MSRQLEAFSDAVVMLVTFTTPTELQQYLRWSDIRYDALIDPTRAVDRAYGLERASVTRVWGFKNLRRYLQIIAGRSLTKIRKPTEDTRQLGGDFVVDREGKLAWGYWPEGPDDRPSVQQLVDAVRACD